MNLRLSKKPLNKQIVGLVIVATAIAVGIAYFVISQYGQFGQKKSDTPTTEATPAQLQITALGRLEPEAEVIKLSAPINLDGDRVQSLLVKEGDRVKAGQIIAVLSSKDRLQDALLVTRGQAKVASSKLAQVKAGAKRGDIQAQQATVERLQAQTQGDVTAQQQAIARLSAQWFGDRKAQEEIIARIQAQWEGDKTAQIATIGKLQAELTNADAELGRYEKLYKQGAISNSLYDSKRLSVETAKQQLSEAKAVLTRIDTTSRRQLTEAQTVLRRIDATNSKQLSEAKIALNRINSTGDKQVSEAKANLNSVSEVRSVDIQTAQAEVENALAEIKRAETELEQAYIKAPTTGQIIKIHTRPGEKLSQDNGVVEMAENEQMVAVAEIYQTDIAKVKLGQQAIITSQGFEGELRGTVYQIGLQVNRQNVFANQPGENLDRRVIDVKIRINPEDSKRVSGLTNLQVQTAINF